MDASVEAISHVTASGRAKIPALTGIRGVAAVWVALFHIGPVVARFLGFAEPGAPISRGYLGVDLFFILSGFVLGMTSAPAMAEAFKPALGRFAIGRAFRILPLHWFVLGAILLLTVLFPNDSWGGSRSTWANFVACLLLVQAWGTPADWALSWNSPAWSLSAEWLAYFGFPILAVLACRLKNGKAALGLSALCLLALAAVMLASGDPSLQHTGRLAAPRCVAEFTAGVLLWRAMDLGALRWIGGGRALIAGLVLVGVAVAAGPPLELVAPFGFAALIVACASPTRAAATLFGARPIAFLGEISFSLYLTHTVVLAGFEALIRLEGLQAAPLAGRFALTAGLAVATLTIPVLTWRFIEIPGQMLGRRLQRPGGTARVKVRPAV
jgi:peptidoglycan/LPS O-acetylase OafA/YrhL